MPVIMNGEKHMIALAVGNPEAGHHPFHFQLEQLEKKGMEVENELMESFSSLQSICLKYNISLDVLTYYTTRISKTNDGGVETKNSELQINALLKNPINPVG
jgi:hypothetical protein